MVNPGRRIPTRGKRTGSVRILMPKKLMRTVAWPTQARVTCASLHLARAWRTPEKSGASFQLSIREKDDRASALSATCPELIVQALSCETVTQPSWLLRRTAIYPLGSAGWEGCATPSGKMRELRQAYRLPNNPLMALQRVLPTLGGPARATSTGTLARFKMLRVKSPMM